MKIKLLFIMLLCANFSLGQKFETSEKERSKSNQRKKHSKTKNVRNFVDTTHVISYDFKADIFYEPIKRIKVHYPVIFQIRNINPFAYKVTLNPRDSVLSPSSFDKEFLKIVAIQKLKEDQEKLIITQNDLSKEIASQASSLTSNDFKKKNEIEGNKDVSKNENDFKLIPTLHEMESKIKTLKQKKDSLSNQIMIDRHASNKLDSLNIYQINYTNIEKLREALRSSVQNSNVKTDSIINENKRLSKLLDSWKNKEEDIEKTIMSKDKLQSNMSEAIKSYHLLANDFYIKYETFMSDSRLIFNVLRSARLINDVANNPHLTYDLYKIKYANDLTVHGNELFKSTTTGDNYRNSFSELTNAYYKLTYSGLLDEFMTSSGIAKTQAYPQYLKEKADILVDFLTKFPVEDITRQAQWVLSILQDPARYDIQSSPIQPENDLLEFQVRITKRISENPEALYKEKIFTYRQPVYGGFRVDFSLGLAASYYMNVSTYELDSLSAIRRIDKTGIAVPSLIVMLTMSRRKTGYIAYGGSAGMGVDVDNGKFQLSNFYLGPTLLLGKKERIFISAGASLRNVKELAYNTPVGTTVPPNIKDLSSYMKDRYKVGIFASITYSLTKDAKAIVKNLW